MRSSTLPSPSAGRRAGPVTEQRSSGGITHLPGHRGQPGIGASVAAMLSRDRHRVALLGRDGPALDAVGAGLPRDVLSVPADVTDSGRCRGRLRHRRRTMGLGRGARRQCRCGLCGTAGRHHRRGLGANARAQPHRAVSAACAARAGDGRGGLGAHRRDRLGRGQARRAAGRCLHRCEARRARPGPLGGCGAGPARASPSTPSAPATSTRR